VREGEEEMPAAVSDSEEARGRGSGSGWLGWPAAERHGGARGAARARTGRRRGQGRRRVAGSGRAHALVRERGGRWHAADWPVVGRFRPGLGFPNFSLFLFFSFYFLSKI
jgi:hypothetical protein